MQGGVEAEHAQVEQLAVQDAQGQAVVEAVGAAEEEPSRVRGLDAGARELAVIAAERSLAAPRLQDPRSPPQIPATVIGIADAWHDVAGAEHTARTRDLLTSQRRYLRR